MANAISDLTRVSAISTEQAEALVTSGFNSLDLILQADVADLEAVKGIGPAAKGILDAVRAHVGRADS